MKNYDGNKDIKSTIVYRVQTAADILSSDI